MRANQMLLPINKAGFSGTTAIGGWNHKCLWLRRVFFLLFRWIVSQTVWTTSGYWNWQPDPHAEGVDTVTKVWNSMRAYAFPPVKLIHHILRKVQDEQSEMLLVAPAWCQQPWYPLLHKSACSSANVSRPANRSSRHSHPLCMNGRLVMAAWLVSGNATEALGFRRRQEHWRGKPSVQTQLMLIGPVGISMVAGVVEGRLIQFRTFSSPLLFFWQISKV